MSDVERDEPPIGEGSGSEAAGEEAPSEEELRARIEENLRKVRVQDVLLESVVTIINLTARRIAKPDERDLDQARVGIDAVRAVSELLEEEPREQVRNALSELQMLYAREAGGGAPSGDAASPAGADAPTEGGGAPEAPPERDTGPAHGGLWTPPGT